MVNWLHGAAHVESCEVVNSGRFMEKAGRRVGENQEVIWKFLKVKPGAIGHPLVVFIS